ncbi:hypothetical protein G9C98_003564 [Cotesia typhae]|uniref:ATP synthase subunit b n=1 Tax=Cotesia typhae TaxID=2053667 RepID=A0A8J5USB3_9HYME|nr:hypothetical protein G9C98_003564 [Cotesia typhae]
MEIWQQPFPGVPYPDHGLFLCYGSNTSTTTSTTVTIATLHKRRGVLEFPCAAHDDAGSLATRLPALTRVQASSSAIEPQRRTRPLYPDPVRHGFIPEEWFQFFYNKTGYTGPYMFALGLSTYLVSKEFYVMEHEYYTGIACLVMSIVVVKNAGPPMAKYLDAEMEKDEEAVKRTRTDSVAAYEQGIEHEKLEQWRIAQKHMTQWIINNVVKSISPDQEKAALQQCISELQSLAPRS